MNLTEAGFLGLIQGLTEFLPVSSSAHLILAPYFFKWQDPGLSFDVALHMGTLAAVLAFFWKDWISVIKQFLHFCRLLLTGNFKQAKKELTLPLRDSTRWWLILLATVPAALLGLKFEHVIEETFRSPVLVAVTLAGFAGVLWYFDTRGKKSKAIEWIGPKQALLIGCAQAVALVPGVSRAGVTMTMGLALGLTRSSAARFSFLISAPIIGGAGILKAKHILKAIHDGGAMAQAIGVGFAASLLSGIAAIGLLHYVVKSRSLSSFVVYRLILAFVIIIVVINR